MEHEHSHDHAYLHEHNIPHLHHETDTHDEAHNHTHSHAAANGHGHVHENTQAVLNRLSRACSEVLIQIAAVRAAITNIGKVILQDHIQHCIVDAVEHDDEQALDALCQAIDKFVK